MYRAILPVLMMALSACVPNEGSLSHQEYERHKSNREAYMYQGGP